MIFRKSTRKARTVSLRWRVCGDTCQSRRSFKIRVPKLGGGEKVRSAAVWVNGKRVRVLRGKRLRARVHLVGLPKGTYRVKIRMRTNSGRTITQNRRFRTCTPKRVKR